MHAAGGLAATPKAMAHWMQVNLDIGDASGALPAAAWQRSQQPIARSKLADGEIDCNGYSLGWYSCSYRGQQALMHPGSYDGAVSVTVLVPSAKAGMSLMANSDSAMEGLQLEMMKAFIGLASGQAGEAERLRKAVEAYPAKVEAKASRFGRKSPMSRSARVPPFVSVQTPKPWAIRISRVRRVAVVSPG